MITFLPETVVVSSVRALRLVREGGRDLARRVARVDLERRDGRPFPLVTMLGFVTMLGLGGLVSGCAPQIGDKCVLSTDCSTRGDRLCDTSQPQGYCTQFNCAKNSCPDEAACVLFNAAEPVCAYDDRSGPFGSRFARAFCVAKCVTDGDCRSGYVCGDPKAAPWLGFIQDDDQSKRTCLIAPPEYYVDGGIPPNGAFTPKPVPVCGPVGPNVPAFDASAPRIDEGPVKPPLVPDAGAPASDAGAPSDAGDGGDGG